MFGGFELVLAQGFAEPSAIFLYKLVLIPRYLYKIHTFYSS